VLDQEFAAQQATGVVGDAAQPLFLGNLFLGPGRRCVALCGASVARRAFFGVRLQGGVDIAASLLRVIDGLLGLDCIWLASGARLVLRSRSGLTLIARLALLVALLTVWLAALLAALPAIFLVLRLSLLGF